MDLLINIDVPDLDRAERFYVEAFGFTVGRRFEGAVELLGGTAPIYLLQNDAGSETAGAKRDYHRHWTPVHIDLVVEDVDAAADRAVKAGATLETGPRDAAWGRIAVLADPFGHGICVLKFTGRGYDELL